MSRPLVSIVTPSFNQGRFIEHNLRSVSTQNYRPIEHVVVDGGSTDGTLSVLRKYEDKYNLLWVSEEDCGQSHALTKGFAMTRGGIIGWVNSDDLYFDKQTISFVAEYFSRHPEVDVVYGDDVAIDESNQILRARWILDWDYSRLLRGLSISQPATFFRNYVVLENQLNMRLHYAMDLEYWLRLGKKYRFNHVRRILAAFRVHPLQKRTAKKDVAHEEDIAVLRMYGQEFGPGYYVARYLSDFPGLLLRRTMGFLESLSFPKTVQNLAFETPRVTKARLLLCQLRPLVQPKASD